MRDYWSYTDADCSLCCEFPAPIYNCSNCLGIGRDPIPWSELFIAAEGSTISTRGSGNEPD